MESSTPKYGLVNYVSVIFIIRVQNLCRRLSLKSNREEYAEKLSQEAYRLYRTVQSLTHTKEPDLVQNLTPYYSTLFEKNSSSSVSACLSFEFHPILFSNNYNLLFNSFAVVILCQPCVMVLNA